MSQSCVPDDLWEAIEPLLPRERPTAQAQGRPSARPGSCCPRRIIFVLGTGTPWRLLPKELGCGSGPTCWRRLRDWQAAGVWAALHRQILNWLGEERAIDWTRATIDSLSVRAKRGEKPPGRTPSTAASWVPSTTCSSTAKASRSRCNSRRPMPTTRPIWNARSTRSRPSSARRANPDAPASGPRSCTPTRATTTPRSAAPSVGEASPRGSPVAGWNRPSGSSATAGWWSVPWLLGLHRLGVRYERRADILRGLLHLGWAVICTRFLRRAAG
jgi:transposase